MCVATRAAKRIATRVKTRVKTRATTRATTRFTTRVTTRVATRVTTHAMCVAFAQRSKRRCEFICLTWLGFHDLKIFFARWNFCSGGALPRFRLDALPLAVAARAAAQRDMLVL